MSAKLGLKPQMRCWRHSMPDGIADLLDAQEPDLALLRQSEPDLDCAHIFVTEHEDLTDLIGRLRDLLAPSGMIWVSWPKKASKVPTSVNEDVVRDVCLPRGLVDVKVCAVDAVWSGLKLVIRKELRQEQARRLTAKGNPS